MFLEAVRSRTKEEISPAVAHTEGGRVREGRSGSRPTTTSLARAYLRIQGIILRNPPAVDSECCSCRAPCFPGAKKKREKERETLSTFQPSWMLFETFSMAGCGVDKSRCRIVSVTCTGHNDALLISWTTSGYSEGGLRYYGRLFEAWLARAIPKIFKLPLLTTSSEPDSLSLFVLLLCAYEKKGRKIW